MLLTVKWTNLEGLPFSGIHQLYTCLSYHVYLYVLMSLVRSCTKKSLPFHGAQITEQRSEQMLDYEDILVITKHIYLYKRTKDLKHLTLVLDKAISLYNV